MLCHYSKDTPSPPAPPVPPPSAPLVLAAPLSQTPPSVQPAVSTVPLHDPGQYPVRPSTVWRATYGVALRGSFVHSGGTNRYEAHLVPNAGLVYRGQGTNAAVSGTATIVQPLDGQARVGAASLDANLDHALGPSTRLSLNGAIEVSQDDPGGIDVTPSGVMTAPLQFRASADAALSRQFGHFDLTGSLGVARSQTGETVLAGGGVIDNSGSDHTRFSGGMRLGYALTPIFGVFVSGDVAREEFDRVSADIGASRSGWDYATRAGVTANWHDMTSFEASVGYGWRTFDAAVLPGTEALLYGVALGFSPDPTLRLRLAFDTAIEPGRNGVVASLDHTLAFEAAYKVNQWLSLRGSASGSWAEAQGTGTLVRRYGAGVGADVILGPHSVFALDYGYGWRSDPGATPQDASEHRMSAGVTLQY
nr:outer membrane beta-barrel protein [Pelagibacterium limicola]